VHRWLEAYQRAKAAAEKALELDATLSEAHTALAGVREREYAWQEAERMPMPVRSRSP